MSEPSTSRTQHIDALVLAFSHSRAKSIVGTDALRTVISGQYREILHGHEFRLEPIWTLLEGQPGFVAADVKPPLCLFKTWEDDLDLDVELPSSFGELTALEIRALADECNVPSKELDRVLERGAFSPTEREARNAKWAEEAAPEPATERTASRHHNLILSVLCVIALAAFGAAGYFVYDGFLKKGEVADVQPSLFSGIPVKSATRRGFDIQVRLSDDGWLALPAAERDDGMRRSLRSFSSDGVRGIFVFDKAGKLRGSAQTYGEAREKIRVRFQ